MLRECHDGPLGGHFGRAKTGSLVRRLVFWVGQDVDVAEYVRSCQSANEAEHCGPRGIRDSLSEPEALGSRSATDDDRIKLRDCKQVQVRQWSQPAAELQRSVRFEKPRGGPHKQLKPAPGGSISATLLLAKVQTPCFPSLNFS